MATVTTSSKRNRPEAVAALEVPAISSTAPLPGWAAFLLVFGLFFTFRGYHAFDGDQAYRLPLLLHWQDPSLFAGDPFVRAFDDFNPHRGYLTLLNLASRPFGLSLALLGLFVLILAATSFGVSRLTRDVWPELGRNVGLVGVILVLLAKGGNIGTNHLFESTLLDRLMGFALGWIALAYSVGQPGRRRTAWSSAACLGGATLIHPSVGIQLALTLSASWVVWGFFSKSTEVRPRRAILAVAAIVLALIPGVFLMAGQSGNLLKGLSSDEFRLLAVMVQGPQHMLPSTWRMSQWLAWGCYPVLAILALGSFRETWPASRVRLACMMAVNLASLGVAYLAVEVVGDLRVTIFQPFRMATLARGLALIAVAGRVLSLWERGDLASRGRAVLIGIGLGGDWSLVVATVVDCGMAVFEAAGLSVRITRVLGSMILLAGLIFLVRHDTESGQIGLMAGLGVLGLARLIVRIRDLQPVLWTARRLALAMGVCWALPLASFWAGMLLKDPGGSSWSAGLVERCRFWEVPTDDLERLAAWVRYQTPETSRFIGPPGPKTFRLWSRRAVAFNRAASPYHAEGLADWSRRFREHVGFQGSTAEFARAYLADRHSLEAAYGRMTDLELATLARSQGADHVLTAANRKPEGPSSPLVLLKSEGRYAVYRISPTARATGEENLQKNSSVSLFNSN